MQFVLFLLIIVLVGADHVQAQTRQPALNLPQFEMTTKEKFDQAQQLIQTNRLLEAKAVLEGILADKTLSPLHKGSAYYMLSFCQDSDESGLVQAGQALLFNRQPQYLFRMAKLLYNLKRYDEALSYINETAGYKDMEGDLALMIFKLEAMCRLETRDYPLALGKINQAVALDNNRADLRFIRGKIYYLMTSIMGDHYQSAIDDLEFVVDSDIQGSDRLDALTYLGQIYESLHKLPKAKRAYQQARRLSTDARQTRQLNHKINSLENMMIWNF